MLTIRREQLAEFRRHLLERFESRMIERFRRPPFLLEGTTDELRAFIRSGMARAAVYGLTSADDVRRFLEYTVVLAPDFDTDPRFSWVANILSAPGQDPAAKLRAIDDGLLFSRDEASS